MLLPQGMLHSRVQGAPTCCSGSHFASTSRPMLRPFRPATGPAVLSLQHARLGKAPASCTAACGASTRTQRRVQRRRPARGSHGCWNVGTAQPAHPEEMQDRNPLPLSLTVPLTAMAKGFGSHGGGAVLDKKKVTIRQTQKTSEPKLDQGGGSGGIGKILSFGGGGDDDGGDDDDYFKPGGSGDDGDIIRPLQELYDARALQAVLAEWGRTIADIPLFIQQSVQLGAYSSAQLMRFMTMDVRPNVTRSATRMLNPSGARGVVGRLMADPAFAQKMVIEQLLAASSNLYWEYRQRGDRFFKELDLVAINTLSVSAATGALVWLIAPSRSFGALHRSSWQNMLHNLPHNVFDTSTPLRKFTLGSRAGGLAWKAAELGAIGAASGAVMSAGGSAALAIRRRSDPGFQPSVPVPELGRSAQGMALSLGAFSNLRYQAVSGIDRVLFERGPWLWANLATTTALRAAAHLVAQPTRLFLQGLPTEIPKSRRAAEQHRKSEAVARLAQLRAQFAARQQQASHPQYVEVDMPASAL